MKTKLDRKIEDYINQKAADREDLRPSFWFTLGVLVGLSSALLAAIFAAIVLYLEIK